jgi:hypothetical protein
MNGKTIDYQCPIRNVVIRGGANGEIIVSAEARTVHSSSVSISFRVHQIAVVNGRFCFYPVHGGPLFYALLAEAGARITATY